MTKLTIQSKQETINGNVNFDKIGEYSISASYTKDMSGLLTSASINMSSGLGRYASYSQNSNSSNASISTPVDATEAEIEEINDIFKQSMIILNTK